MRQPLTPYAVDGGRPYLSWFGGQSHAETAICGMLYKQGALTAPELTRLLAKQLPYQVDKGTDEWRKLRQAVNFHAKQLTDRGVLQRSYDYSSRSMLYSLASARAEEPSPREAD